MSSPFPSGLFHHAAEELAHRGAILAGDRLDGDAAVEQIGAGRRRVAVAGTAADDAVLPRAALPLLAAAAARLARRRTIAVEAHLAARPLGRRRAAAARHALPGLVSAAGHRQPLAPEQLTERAAHA